MDGVKGAQLNDAQKKLRGLNLRKTPLRNFWKMAKLRGWLNWWRVDCNNDNERKITLGDWSLIRINFIS